jgi:hypothetical protein
MVPFCLEEAGGVLRGYRVDLGSSLSSNTPKMSMPGLPQPLSRPGRLSPNDHLLLKEIMPKAHPWKQGFFRQDSASSQISCLQYTKK